MFVDREHPGIDPIIRFVDLFGELQTYKNVVTRILRK
jgi:hypothetical protein